MSRPQPVMEEKMISDSVDNTVPTNDLALGRAVINRKRYRLVFRARNRRCWIAGLRQCCYRSEPLKQLRVVDQDGKQRSFLSEFLPRIGERIVVVYGVGSEPVRDHYFRVRDVMYRLDDEPENQAAILVSEEENAQLWPSLS